MTFAIFFSGLGNTILQYYNAEYFDDDYEITAMVIGVICVIIGLVFGISLCVIGCQLRGFVRNQKNIEGGACGDFCCMCCCNCCSLIQMSKEYGMVVDRPGGDDFEVEIRIQQRQPVSGNSIAPEISTVVSDMVMQNVSSGVDNSGFQASAPPSYPVLSK